MNTLGSTNRRTTGSVRRIFFFTMILCLLAGSAIAQNDNVVKVVQFKDGSTVVGKIVEMNIYTVKIQTADGSTVVKKFDDITSIQNKDDIVPPKSFLPVHSLDIGLEAFYKEYKEPDVNVKETGMMYGIALGYTYHDKVMAKASLLFAYGEVNYENSGKLDGIPDHHWELRGLLGYDFPIDPTFFITPYFGLGYRYLGDDSSGKISTTGAHGYKRESNYVYSPLGISLIKGLPEGWMLSAEAEFDFLWYGKQKSYPAGVEIDNTQNQGYGLRASIRMEKKFTYTSFFFEPFIRYWDIGQSDDYNIAPGRSAFEPKNNTTEYGLCIGLKF